MNRLAFIKSCGATLVATVAGMATSAAKEKKPDTQDTRVFDFPNPVQKTVLDFTGEGTIHEITKRRVGAKSWLYVVKYSRKGQKLVLTTSEAGKLIRIESAEEEPVKKQDKGDKVETKPKAEPAKATSTAPADPAANPQTQTTNTINLEDPATRTSTDATWDETWLDDPEDDSSDDVDMDDSDNDDSSGNATPTTPPATPPATAPRG